MAFPMLMHTNKNKTIIINNNKKDSRAHHDAHTRLYDANSLDGCMVRIGARMSHARRVLAVKLSVT